MKHIRSTGGYTGTSVGSQDLIPILRADVAALTPTVGINKYNVYDDHIAPFRLHEISILPDAEMVIEINDSTQITVPTTGFSVEDVLVKKLVTVTNAVAFDMVYKY